MMNLKNDIEEYFREWQEMGYSSYPFLINLLQKEREENAYLKTRIKDLEKKIYEIHRSTAGIT